MGDYAYNNPRFSTHTLRIWVQGTVCDSNGEDAGTIGGRELYKELHVNAYALAAMSPVYRSMFERWETAERIVETTVDSEDEAVAFEAMISFIYHCELQPIQKGSGTLLDLLLMADKYEVARLMDVVYSELKCAPQDIASPTNLTKLVNLPLHLQHRLAWLPTLLPNLGGDWVSELESKFEFLDNMGKEFLQLPMVALSILLQSPKVRVWSEDTVFLMVMGWADANNCTARQMGSPPGETLAYGIWPALKWGQMSTPLLLDVVCKLNLWSTCSNASEHHSEGGNTESPRSPTAQEILHPFLSFKSVANPHYREHLQEEYPVLQFSADPRPRPQNLGQLLSQNPSQLSQQLAIPEEYLCWEDAVAVAITDTALEHLETVGCNLQAHGLLFGIRAEKIPLHAVWEPPNRNDYDDEYDANFWRGGATYWDDESVFDEAALDPSCVISTECTLNAECSLVAVASAYLASRLTPPLRGEYGVIFTYKVRPMLMDPAIKDLGRYRVAEKMYVEFTVVQLLFNASSGELMATTKQRMRLTTGPTEDPHFAMGYAGTEFASTGWPRRCMMPKVHVALIVQMHRVV